MVFIELVVIYFHFLYKECALYLIFQYKPDIQFEISQLLQNIIKDNNDLVLDTSGKTCVRFTTKAIDGAIPKKGEGWVQSKRMLLFEMNNTENRLALKLIIGPGQADIQDKLYNLMKVNNALFNKANVAYGKKWNTVYLSEYLKKKDYEDFEMETVGDKIRKKFESFVQKDLKEMESYILEHWE